MQISRLAYSPLEGDGKIEPPPRSFLNRMIRVPAVRGRYVSGHGAIPTDPA